MENNKKNMLYSPLSIEYALNMLKEGAANNTLAEIEKVIDNRKLTKYQSIDKNLSFANGLFIRDTFYNHVLSSYIDILKEKYDAEIKKDPFESAKNANDWIEDKTLGIIKNLLDDKLFEDPLTSMLIINALAIDMEWANPFDSQHTQGKSFYKDDGEKITVTTMYRSKLSSIDVAYYLDDDLTVLTMNLRKYKDVQLEFMALMPNKEDLSGFVKNITKAQIADIDEQLNLAINTEYGVNIQIPKFKFDYKLKLKEDLKSLGIEEAFTRGIADFSNMVEAHSPDEELYVSDAIHKADIEFGEEGVKAAAVAVYVTAGSGYPLMPDISNPVDIIIDKPFMFIIRDKATKDIWFTGTLYEPNLWENDKEEYTPKFVYNPRYGN